MSTRPRGGDWLEDEVAGWRAAGLHIIVSLLERDEAAQLGLIDEGRMAKSEALEFILFPIPDRGVPSSTSEAASLIDELTSALAAGKNVAIHCRQGVGRSAMMAAAALITAGSDAREAIQIISRARGVEVPETPDQVKWLERYASHRLALPT